LHIFIKYQKKPLKSNETSVQERVLHVCVL